MKELSTEKVMTVKEVASVLGVSKDTIFNCIKRIMPNKMQERKTTFLNEKEVSLISKELKGNNAVLDRLSVEVSSTVVNTTTELEILANYKQAQEQFTQLLERKNAELQNIINEQKPLVQFAETVTNTLNAISIGDFAKLLADEKISIGQNRLFTWLRENKYLMSNNVPMQRYIESGLFRVIEQTYKTAYGEKVNIKTLITGKGQVYFCEKLRETISKNRQIV